MKEPSKQPKLTMPERNRLVLLEDRIAKGEKALLEMAAALDEIRTKGLYRDGRGRDFEGYCRERWGKTSRRINQIRVAAEIMATIMKSEPGVPIPTNEKQCRALTRVPPAAQAIAFGAAVESADGKQPTGGQVANAASSIDMTEESLKRLNPAARIEYMRRVAARTKELNEADGVKVGGDQSERFINSMDSDAKRIEKNCGKLGGDLTSLAEVILPLAKGIRAAIAGHRAVDLLAAA